MLIIQQKYLFHFRTYGERNIQKILVAFFGHFVTLVYRISSFKDLDNGQEGINMANKSRQNIF